MHTISSPDVPGEDEFCGSSRHIDEQLELGTTSRADDEAIKVLTNRTKYGKERRPDEQGIISNATLIESQRFSLPLSTLYGRSCDAHKVCGRAEICRNSKRY